MTSEHLADQNQWTAVDQTNDPQAFVRFLSTTRARTIEAAERDPRAAFAYLDVHEGQRILDAACGLGHVACILARLVGPTGQVIGVDRSETMIRHAEARTHAPHASALSVAFRQGDITALDFPESTFDRAHAARVLEHVPDPSVAVGELVRVTRPGGLVALVEPDYDSYVIDADNRNMSRQFARFLSDRVIRNGQIGLKLPTLMRAAGLTDIRVEPQAVLSSYTGVRGLIESTVEQAITEGAMDGMAARSWLVDINARGTAGAYVAAFLLFRASGTVPN